MKRTMTSSFGYEKWHECDWCLSDYGQRVKADVVGYKAKHGRFDLCGPCIEHYEGQQRFLAAGRIGFYPNL